MKRWGLIGLAGLALLGGPSSAQTPPEGLTWMALRDINAAYFDQDDPTNRPPLTTRVPEGMIRAVNVTPDGHPDWLVDYHAAEMSGYCGTGGCTKILYVSLGDDGLTRAFDEQAHELTFYAVDGEIRIEAQVHHAMCSGDATRRCAYAWAWSPELRRLVERPNRAGETVISVGAFAPIDRSGDKAPNDAAPAPVAQRWFHTRTTCSSPYVDDGLEVRRAALHDIPDVDGDGVRDWVVEPPAACQAEPDDTVPYPGFEVWLTRDGGEAVQAYVSPADRYPRIDIGASPAVMVTEPPCSLGETCPVTHLRWNPGQARLVEAAQGASPAG